MSRYCCSTVRGAVVVAILSVLSLPSPANAQAKAVRAGTGLRIEISFPQAAHGEPITGRVFVMMSRAGDREPRLQIGRTGTPFFGRDVEKLAPGQAAVIDETDLGTPVESLRDIPAGDYFVQAMVNVYSEFRRADGHVVWMHDDQWEGQHWNRVAGQPLQRGPDRCASIPRRAAVVNLVADKVIPPVQRAARHAVGEALQVPEPVAHEVLGPADLPRRHRAAAARLRQARR